MSGSCISVKGFGYYEKQEETAGNELGYYDNNQTQGRFLTLTSEGFDPASFTPLVTNGAKTTTAELKMLSKGLHPVTEEQLVQKNKKRSVAYDFTLSAPKSVSVLWGLAKGQAALAGANSDHAQKTVDAIDEAHRIANDKAMAFAHRQGWIVTRRGKGGKTIEGAGHIAIAQWDHNTSRAGDMQKHTHNVISNVCLREDGTSGSIDNKQLLMHKREISVMYRAELAAQLKAKLGLSVSKDEKNFEIDGISEKLLTQFSKRRNKILERMEERGLEGTANNRQAAQMANFQDREAKSEQPDENVLHGRWTLEAKTLNESFLSVWESTQEAAKAKEDKAALLFRLEQEDARRHGREVPTERVPFKIEELSAKALAAVTEHEAAFEERKLCTLILEELQVHVGADEAWQIYEGIKAETAIIKIGMNAQEPVYTTPELHDLELELLQRAQRMQANKVAIDPAIIERAIAKGRVIDDTTGEIGHYTPEQANLIRHFFGPNQFDLGNGGAGTGKSFAQAGVKDIAENDLGLRVHVLAPSWKAVDVARKDTGVDLEYARAVTGWINSVRKGDLVVDRHTFILVDEFGMLGHRQANELLKIAEETGAQLKGVGDFYQLQPVAAGGSMRALVDTVGAAYMVKVNRQKIGWQLEASESYSAGDIQGALTPYFTNERMIICDDGDSAMDQLVAKYMENIAEFPGKTRLILAATNGEAAALHDRIRKLKIENGELEGPSVAIQTIARGANGRVIETEYQKGDRIILGETLTLNGERYINNSIGTVEEVRMGKEGAAVFTINWDDGRTLTATTNELCGYREEGSNMIGIPKIAHAYAMTIHASQGTTVDYCFNYNGRGFARENGYVAMTRHRWDCWTFVDGSRPYDELSARTGVTMEISRRGGKTQQADAVGDDVVTEEMIRAKLIQEYSKSQGKMNVSDFQENRKEWALNTKPIGDKKGDQPKMEPSTAESINAEELKANSNATATVLNPYKVRGLGVTPAEVAQKKAAAAAEEDRVRMEKIANSAKAPTLPKAEALRKKAQNPNYIAPISDAEKEHFAKYDLRQYFLDRGAEYSPDKSGPKGSPYTQKNGGKGTAYELHWSKGQGFLAVHRDNGEWSYQNRFDSERGGLVSYVMKHDNLDIVSAWRKLRDETGSHHLIEKKASNDFAQAKAKEAAAPKIELTPTQKFEQTLAAGKAHLQAQIDNVQRFWNDSKEGISPYLSLRKITEETQRWFNGSFRNEPEAQYDPTYSHKVPTKNPGGVQFPMIDPNDDTVTGISRKGQGQFNQGYGVAAKDSIKNLVIMKGAEPDQNPKYLLVGENQIDPMSLWQHNAGDGKGRTDTWLVSSAGEPGQNELAGLYKLAKEHPQATFVFVGQNDKPSLAIQDKVTAAILAGNENAKIVVRRPSEEFNDWNDVLQDKKMTAEQIASFRLAAAAHEESKGKGEATATYPNRPVSAEAAAARAEKVAKEREEAAEVARRMREADEARRKSSQGIGVSPNAPAARPRGPRL